MEEYVFFSSKYEHLQTGHVMIHKVSLNKFQRIEFIKSSLSDRDSMKIEINNQRKSRNILLNKIWSQNK